MHPTKPLDGFLPHLLALTLCVLLSALSPAAYAAPEKLDLTSFSVSPGTISPSENQGDPAPLTLNFALSPTAALKAWLEGHVPAGVDRSFHLSCLVEVKDSTTNVVHALAAELPLSQTEPTPSQLPKRRPYVAM